MEMICLGGFLAIVEQAACLDRLLMPITEQVVYLGRLVVEWKARTDQRTGNVASSYTSASYLSGRVRKFRAHSNSCRAHIALDSIFTCLFAWL